MPSPEAASSLPFHRLHRRGRTGVGWAVLGVVVVGALVAIGIQLVLLPLFLLVSQVGIAVDLDPLTPGGLARVNLAWAAAIPVALVVPGLVHRLPIGWLTSVAGRFRWTWFAVCFGPAAVALALTVLVAAYLPQQEGVPVGGDLNDFTSRTAAYVVVVLLLTPLQAAGEEYVFRGYLTQVFGGLVGGRLGLVLAIVVPATVFALAHGAQDPPVFVERLAFGLVAGIVVIVTGGLEAAIAMHVLNNWVAFGLALAFGDMDAALRPTAASWWGLPTTLVQSVVFLGLTVWLARWVGLERRATVPVLERPNGRV